MNVGASSPPSSRKQKRLGPAPIASMEETAADEKAQVQMDHQNNYQSHRWLNDKPSTDSNRGSPTKSFDCPSALTPATPRIDISRASSHSSHHDSRDSSPENVFDQVGTGTLQDSGVLGFREEDTLDLRNSTEELQFMEPQKGTHEKEKPNTQIIYSSSLSQRYSPIIWKLDDQSTLLTQQHHSQQQQTQQQLHNRKDSASSEVVAFLSISGRTSRLSSVGSQGSANSKLSATSALSAISRSPSPHKMLLETSFCGAKPLQTFAEGAIVGSSLEASTEKVLEQVILSRKKDPTEAVLAEGVNIHVTTSSFTSNEMRSGRSNCFHQQPSPGVGVVRENPSEENGGRHVRRKSDCGTATVELDMMQQLKVTQTSRSVGNKRHIPPRDLKNSIIGTMPSGTEYIRIKLKPDHCYSDNGIADNERIVEKTKENGGHELSVSHDHTRANDRLEPHHNTSTARSPSPANVSVSRKNSFCSLFKFRDVGPNDKSQNLQQHSQQLSRKKRSSTASNESGMIGGDMSANSTPSKQKLVLKMFKSKRDPKSKSPSPMGSTADAIGQSFTGGGSGGDQYATSNMSVERSPGTTGLRYYDAPLDGQSIHIPLHTPPEERSLAGGSFRSTTSGHKTSSHIPVADNHGPVLASATTSQSILKHSKQNTTPKQQRIANMTVTIHDRPKPMPPLKCYRIDNPDGSIIIPLKSPIEEKTGDSHQWENVIGELSQRIEMQAGDCRDGLPVPTAAGSGSKSNSATTNHRPSSLLNVESASHSQKQGSQHILTAESLPIPPPPPPPPPFSTSPSLPSTSCANPVPIAASSTGRKLVMAAETHGTLPQQAAAAAVMMRQRQQQQSFFKLRMGSGSEEQIFSTTLNDYSKELHRNSSNVSQSSSVATPQRSSNENDSEPVGWPPGGIVGDGPSGKPFAGNCSEHPDERAVSVTSSSSPQQVPMSEREKNGVKEPPPEHRQQSQQQHQYVTTSNTEATVTTSPNGDYAAADATVSRRSSSSPIEYASSEYKNYHYHHQQHHYSQPRNHRQKQRHKHQDPASTNEDVLIGAVAADVSSESEKDSEIDSVSTTGRHAVRPNMLTIEDHESAGLVFQESFDDELPYIPTTLPEEKPIGIKLMPVKERAQIGLKYHPLERPRSTTPIHPDGWMDAYCDRSTIAGLSDTSAASQALGERGAFGVPGGGTEKLRISLPAKKPGENTGASSGSSAKRILEHRSSLGAITLSTPSVTAAVSAGTARSASAGGAMAKQIRMIRCRAPTEDMPSPPPLPPRKATGVTATPPGHQWIDVELLPEVRKAPKRITAIPQKPQQQQQQQQKQPHDHQSSTSSRQPETSLHRQEIDSDGQIYTYVNPEDCQCECHEHERSAASTSTIDPHYVPVDIDPADDCGPLLRSSSSSSTAGVSSTPAIIDPTSDPHNPTERL